MRRTRPLFLFTGAIFYSINLDRNINTIYKVKRLLGAIEDTMEQDDGKLGRLTEASLKRKERLRRLKELALKSGKTDSGNDESLPKPVFRSYKPLDENTIGQVLQQEPTGEIESEISSQIELLNTPIVIDEIDIANLAPRKADWDLKRDVAKKLEILERRTQKAIAELIRERLKKDQDDIFQVVNVGTSSGLNINIGRSNEND